MATHPTLERRRQRKRRRQWLVLAALALVALAAFGLWWMRAGEPATELVERPPAELPEAVPPVAPERDDAAGEPATPAEEPVPAPAPPAEPLPALAASDPLVRERAGGLSANAAFGRWLDREGLIRRFAASVDNVAEGRSPASHLAFLAPRRGFLVLGGGEDEDTRIDPASYARYDGVGEVVASLDAAACARLFSGLEPLLDAAYRDLGYPEGRFRDRWIEATAELLGAPVVSGMPRLEPGVLRWKYADPELEGLSDAQRHLLRMGPKNVRRVQAKLREIAAALGVPAERLPAPSTHLALDAGSSP